MNFKRQSDTQRTRRASAGAAGAPALRERFHPSKFCGSAVCCSTQAPAAEAVSLIGKETL